MNKTEQEKKEIAEIISTIDIETPYKLRKLENICNRIIRDRISKYGKLRTSVWLVRNASKEFWKDFFKQNWQNLFSRE